MPCGRRTRGSEKILQFLIWNEADVDKVGRDGRTALALAVERVNVEGEGILLQAGAMPEDSLNMKERPAVCMLLAKAW